MKNTNGFVDTTWPAFQRFDARRQGMQSNEVFTMVAQFDLASYAALLKSLPGRTGCSLPLSLHRFDQALSSLFERWRGGL